MSEPLAPKLKKISVKYGRLYLDPNNPRFVTRKEDRIDEEHVVDQDTVGITKDKISNYKIDELVRSIKTSGWLPVDAIFVRKLAGEADRYVVLEGNRRVAAIRAILADENCEPKLKKSLESIEVMEVLDSGTTEELQRKISYLLGVRHHGSLVRWTPFAQAHNIWRRYLELLSKQSPATFEWNRTVGQEVADTLSIDIDEVEARLRVYRAMNQIGEFPEVKAGSGMRDRYYSICAEPLLSPRKQLGTYIHQDSKTFLLDAEGVARMENLCHFKNASREDAPIHNPPEWGYLDKILADEDIEKKTKNLRLVEMEKKRPSVVWAERAQELAKLTWEKWLLEVNSILKMVTLQELTDTKDAVQAVGALIALLDQLETQDVH